MDDFKPADKLRVPNFRGFTRAELEAKIMYIYPTRREQAENITVTGVEKVYDEAGAIVWLASKSDHSKTVVFAVQLAGLNVDLWSHLLFMTAAQFISLTNILRIYKETDAANEKTRGR